MVTLNIKQLLLILAPTTLLVDYRRMDSKEFLEKIVPQLTGNPANIKMHEDDHGIIFEIMSHSNNSMLIGKGGGTMRAIAVLAKVLGYNGKHRIKIILRESQKNASTKKT